MTKYDPEEEKRMAQASDFYARNPHVKKSAIARQFRVKYRLWKARLAGRKPQNTKGAYNKTLNPDQEEAVKQFIDFLIYLGHKADLKTIRAAANKILAESASTHQVARVWAQRWFKRNKAWFKTLRAKTLAQERKAANRKEDLEEHFKEYYGALEK
jgi:ribosomal protein L17